MDPIQVALELELNTFEGVFIKYRTRAIISRGLYTFYPISKDHLCTVTFGLMYGLFSRAAYDGARTVNRLKERT